MSFSQNPNFVSTRSDIIRDAFSILNIYGAAESVDAADYELANRFLNRMIKTWMAQGYHLWLKETAFLFTKKGQIKYDIYSTSQDHATLNYYKTTLSNEVFSGSNVILVDNADNININDYIGILLNNNDIFWATVIDKLGLYITLNYNVTTDISSGNVVYTYSKKIDNPLNIYSAVRNENDIDIPLNSLSYEEYFQLPNKEEMMIPVSYNYDRQLDRAVIRLWSAPSTSKILIKLILSRKIYNMDNNSDEPDFPMEWHEAITYNLAVRIAPVFGKNKDVGFQSLVQMASTFLNNALLFDNECESIYFQPTRFQNA